MIAILPIDCAADGRLVSTNATNIAAYGAGTTYAVDAVCSYAGRNWLGLQAANIGKTPDLEPLWWADDGPINTLAMFDSSVQTATKTTNGLTFVVRTGRATAIGLMGLAGDSVTITARSSLSGPVLYTKTQSLLNSNGTYYGFTFEPLYRKADMTWTGLIGSADCHVTVEISGTGSTECGLFVAGKQFDCGVASYGFSVTIEDRGRQYLDALGNPVTVDRGYSRSCSGKLTSKLTNFNRLVAFYAENVNNPCLWVAAPGLTDLVSANVFGRASRVSHVITNFSEIETSLEINGYR